MNICFIGSLIYPGQLQRDCATGEMKSATLDGGVRRMLPLLKHVQSKGHQVIMVIPTMQSSDRYEEFDGFLIYHLGSAKKGSTRFVPCLSGTLLFAKIIRTLRRVVSTHDVDLIHAFDPTLIAGVPG